MRYLSLGVVLAAFWLALSGHYTTLLLAFGALSTALCLFVAARMRVVDAEGHPIQLIGGAVTYFPWLIWEVVKSAWAVSKLVLDPRARISPTMTVVDAGQRSSVGVATYANSITLTPGTITVGVDGKRLTVHALTLEGALDLEGGAMNARVNRFEGGA